MDQYTHRLNVELVKSELTIVLILFTVFRNMREIFWKLKIENPSTLT